MQSLIYVSNNCISRDCKAHPFFEQEKEFLLDKFGDFHAISTVGIFKVSKAGIKLLHSATRMDKLVSWLNAINGDFFGEIRHMIADKKISLKKLIKLFRFTKRGMMLERFIEKCASNNAFLYSYWVSYDGYAIARQKRKHKEYKTLARAHAFDIQLNRNDANPYLMKSVICKYIDKIAFISNNGYQDFLSYYKKEQENFTVCYLGSKEKLSGFIKRTKDEAFTIISCASIVPIKQIDHMIDALAMWDVCRVKWIHVGDGPLSNEIKDLAHEKLSGNPLVEYEFTGRLQNEKVSELLKKPEVNLFVNSSKLEGVPVSIMEAMSTGLPVVAPKVGGIPELVREGSGFVFGENGLKDALMRFSNLSSEEVSVMSESAYAVWSNNFCLEKNNEILFKEV